jgi:thymidylate kinase
MATHAYMNTDSKAPHLLPHTDDEIRWAEFHLLGAQLDHYKAQKQLEAFLALGGSAGSWNHPTTQAELFCWPGHLQDIMLQHFWKVCIMKEANRRYQAATSVQADAPELLFFAEVDGDDCGNDAPAANSAAYTDHAESGSEEPEAYFDDEQDSSEVPELISDSGDDSADEDQYVQLPRPYHKPHTPFLPSSGMYNECPALAPPSRSDNSESFPDDDALADHRDLTLASLVDGSNLTPEQFTNVLQLLEDNRDVFCFHPSELGTCTIGCHTIDTGDAAPIKKAYYRMPYKKYEQLKEHINRLLENNIIRPSSSPWSAPMHLVPKKGNETREVVDYRVLNAVTKGDAFPIPRIDDILYNIGSANYFSVLDVNSGYLQIKMDGAPDDPTDTTTTSPSIERTAFAVPWGHYEYVRMPFGVQGGPATFMRIQQEVLEEFIGKNSFVFFDDTITFSNGFQRHYETLQQIFQRLREVNLKLNPVKCQFFRSHVTFLGFVVDKDGLSPDPRLVEAIASRRAPTNAKGVASFLGLTGYYRRFVKDYSKIAEPLTRLLSPKVKFTWGPGQQEAFSTLKDRLITYPILRQPDFTRPFILHTDASSQAVGAVLAQKDEEGKEHVVAYHSKKLTPAERNWPITHLECFAVINAMCDDFADFLLGHKVTVYTDCSALQWLKTSPKLQGKLARWSMRLQEFDYELEWRKGSQHQAADAMTRYCDLEPAAADESDAPAELLTMQGPPPDLRMPPQPAQLPGTFTPPPATPGSAESGRSLSPDSLDEAIRSSIRICVEGNIGCGKSSVIGALQELQDTHADWEKYTIIPEPVHEWHHLLGPLYAAPPNSSTRHSIATLLQISVLNAYALRVPSPVYAPRVITERSSWSSLAVFLPAQDLPSGFEHVVSQTAHHLYPNLDNALPTAIVYLKTDPATCMERIQQRQRPGENMLTLEYITRLHEQYERELALFPGPVITIDATKTKEAVASAVKCAIELLMGAGALMPPRPPHSNARRIATAPFHTQDFPMLRRLFPERILTTCDPYLLHLFPEQLLIHEEAADEANSNLAASTPPPTPAAQGTSIRFQPYAFESTPIEPLYDKESEVLVLFQNGAGTFSFSPQFCTEYARRFGQQVDPQHRIDNLQALELYAEMGPWLVNGPDANIQIAAVPKKAATAIQVLQVHADGTEVVFVDTDKYAAMRQGARTEHDSSKDFWKDTDYAFPWQDAFRSEAYSLDGWVRLMRLRPMLPCGITLLNPRTPTLFHSATPPFESEFSPAAPSDRLRLAGGVPHQSEGLQLGKVH